MDFNTMDPEDRKLFDIMASVARDCEEGRLDAKRFMPLVAGFFCAWQLAESMGDEGHDSLLSAAYSMAFEQEAPPELADHAAVVFYRLADEYARCVGEALDEVRK